MKFTPRSTILYLNLPSLNSSITNHEQTGITLHYHLTKTDNLNIDPILIEIIRPHNQQFHSRFTILFCFPRVSYRLSDKKDVETVLPVMWWWWWWSVDDTACEHEWIAELGAFTISAIAVKRSTVKSHSSLPPSLGATRTTMTVAPKNQTGDWEVIEQENRTQMHRISRSDQ